jgi:hypothetical protein
LASPQTWNVLPVKVAPADVPTSKNELAPAGAVPPVGLLVPYAATDTEPLPPLEVADTEPLPPVFSAGEVAVLLIAGAAAELSSSAPTGNTWLLIVGALLLLVE